MKDDVRKPTGDVDEFWNEFYWEDLTPDERALFKDLGWTQSSWDDDDGEVPADNKDWADLSRQERAALTALGYDKEYWDS